MPGFDYNNLRDQIKLTLEQDSDLVSFGPPVVQLESEIDYGAEDVPAVFIYLTDRNAAEDLQRAAAGTRTDFLVNGVIWCCHFSLDNLQRAIELRDDLISRVEVAIMRNRTLNGAVSAIWLTGGELIAAAGTEGGFYTMGEVTFTVHAISTTT